MANALPFASLLALLICWIGLGVFCLKMYYGIEAFEAVSTEAFAFLLPWLKMVKSTLVAIGWTMVIVTTLMCLVCFSSTAVLKSACAGHRSSCFYSRFGSRFTCGLFCLLSYALNVCWLGILCVTVTLISVYLIFKPICLPQAGLPSERCFNFTLISAFLSGNQKGSAVNLILCGSPISQFCKITQVLAPWYWSSFIGCLAVLLGISQFNGCLAANFAHSKHTCIYLRLHAQQKVPQEQQKHELPLQQENEQDQDDGCRKGTSLITAEKQLASDLLRKFQFWSPPPGSISSLHQICV